MLPHTTYTDTSSLDVNGNQQNTTDMANPPKWTGRNTLNRFSQSCSNILETSFSKKSELRNEETYAEIKYEDDTDYKEQCSSDSTTSSDNEQFEETNKFSNRAAASTSRTNKFFIRSKSVIGLNTISQPKTGSYKKRNSKSLLSLKRSFLKKISRSSTNVNEDVNTKAKSSPNSLSRFYEQPSSIPDDEPETQTRRWSQFYVPAVIMSPEEQDKLSGYSERISSPSDYTSSESQSDSSSVSSSIRKINTTLETITEDDDGFNSSHCVDCSVLECGYHASQPLSQVTSSATSSTDTANVTTDTANVTTDTANVTTDTATADIATAATNSTTTIKGTATSARPTKHHVPNGAIIPEANIVWVDMGVI